MRQEKKRLRGHVLSLLSTGLAAATPLKPLDELTDAPPLVHIGYHKTGSSWLQGRIFDQPPLGLRMHPRLSTARLLIEPPPFSFDLADFRRAVDPWLAQTREMNLIPVFSHERLSGYPHSGGFDSWEIAERLATALPEARVLVAVREQTSLILSNYHQYLRDGGASPLSRYLDPPQSGHRRVPAFSLEFFEFHRLITAYRELFGAANVMVLAFEELGSSPVGFVRRILKFAGLEADHPAPLGERVDRGVLNPAPSASALAAIRLVNLLFRASPLHPSPVLPSRAATAIGTRLALGLRRLPMASRSSRGTNRERELVERRVRGVYEESNARLCELVGIDLARYGYALPAG